jgi:hypothetical protein
VLQDQGHGIEQCFRISVAGSSNASGLGSHDQNYGNEECIKITEPNSASEAGSRGRTKFLNQSRGHNLRVKIRFAELAIQNQVLKSKD